MKLKLHNVRLSFADRLFEAKQYDGKGAFRYGATFLIEPGSGNDKAIRAEITKAAAEKFGKKAKANLEAWEKNTNKNCYTPGDLKEYDGWEGMMVLSSNRGSGKGAPGVYDNQADPATGKVRVLTAKDGKPYSGCYVNATVEIYAQDAPNDGIRCGLVGVQFARDGDAFGGGAPASPDDFDDLGMEEMPEDDDLVL